VIHGNRQRQLSAKIDEKQQAQADHNTAQPSAEQASTVNDLIIR
jgi:hypothetical protein